MDYTPMIQPLPTAEPVGTIEPHSLYQHLQAVTDPDTMPSFDTVGELLDAESGNFLLLGYKSSKMRDSRLLHFFPVMKLSRRRRLIAAAMRECCNDAFCIPI